MFYTALTQVNQFEDSNMDRIFSKINDLNTVLWVETAMFIAAVGLIFGLVVQVL